MIPIGNLPHLRKNFEIIASLFFQICLFSMEEMHEETTPLTGYDNVPEPPEKKKISIPIKKIPKKDETLIENYVNIEQKIIFCSKRTTMADNDDDDNDQVPILLPKQHPPIKKSSLIKPNVFEHYQLPPKDDVDEDEYQPPLPPKQRQNTSRAMVYDFIGSELQELRVALAQFDGNSSSK